jgi:hypothetical protein
MRKAYLYIGGIVVLLSAMPIILVLWIKATAGEFHIGTNARNVSRVTITHLKPGSLRRTRAVWADRRFDKMPWLTRIAYASSNRLERNLNAF